MRVHMAGTGSCIRAALTCTALLTCACKCVVKCARVPRFVFIFLFAQLELPASTVLVANGGVVGAGLVVANLLRVCC